MVSLAEIIEQNCHDEAALRCALEAAVNHPITDKQWEVLRLRFGLDRGRQRRDAEETAELLGLTRREVIDLGNAGLRRRGARLRRKPIRDFYA